MMQAAPNTTQDDEAPQRDRAAALQASRHAAQRYANPSFSTPDLQALASDLREEGDEDDEAAADELDESSDDIADEAAQTDDLSMLSRVKAQMKAEADKGMQKMLQKGQKELERMTANLKLEGAAKFASAADQGEGFEVADVAGTSVSVGHAVLSLFQNSLNETTKDMLAKQGLPMLEMRNPLDIAIVAGTNVQVLWSSFKIVVLIPFCIIFIVMSAMSACDASFVCNNGGGILSTISNFLGS